MHFFRNFLNLERWIAIVRSDKARHLRILDGRMLFFAFIQSRVFAGKLRMSPSEYWNQHRI